MIDLTGVGWFDAAGGGCAGIGCWPERGVHWPAARLETASELCGHPLKNRARFPQGVTLCCAATALALRAAGIHYGPGRYLPTGMLCTGSAPVLDANLAYFRDYVDNGRQLGRGNLFIYTLPTSGVAEASIHFGLRGPQFHIGVSGPPLTALLHAAIGVVQAGDTPSMLAFWGDAAAAVCFAVAALPAGPQAAFAPAADTWSAPPAAAPAELAQCLRDTFPAAARAHESGEL